MGKVRKQTGKSSIKRFKRSKTLNHLHRTYLPRASEDPNRKHKVAEKVIDHKIEELHVWYLIRFKDMPKPQWLPESSISGCKQLIQEYWIRENAVKEVVITADNNYIGQYVQSRIDSRFQFESDAEFHNSVTSPKIHKNYSQCSDDQALQKPQDKIAKSPTINKSSIRYEENRQVSLHKATEAAETTKNQNNFESNSNIETSKSPKEFGTTLSKGKNKMIGPTRLDDLVTQLREPSDIERDLSSLDKFFIEIRSEMGIPQKLPTPTSIRSHSTENNELSKAPSKAPINRNIKWSGNIIKGSLVLFVASVNVTPFPGRCENVATLEKIVNEKVPKLCIQHSLPLSYALNLVKDKDSSEYSVFEIKPSQVIKSRHNVSMEKTIMMRSKIVGVIWIEEYKTAWIIFPYHERICNILKLPDKKELKLFAVSISVPPIFDPLPLNSELGECLVLPKTDGFSVEETIKTKIFLRQTGYYSKLLGICKDRIHFKYFGNEGFSDIQELLLAMRVLGAIYEENYSENISIVFVRGMVSATTYTFLKEDQVTNRIMNVIDHQLTTRATPWDYLLYVNVMDNLADIGQSQNNQHALRAWHETMAAIGAKKARYIKKEEIFMPNKIYEEPPPMVSSLYRTMLRIHTMYAAERRDFILIRHKEEEELMNEPVPGVWKMSLQEFEQIFGPTNK
ncbi:hypothetical protein C1645_879790 [Glomus cerebriforme]|uniref:Chromo domain-containing protein n=1 Tax=Glomus cerebriforme TaxID=658196 RepID=A0A397SIG3_9GLOM|nr:hypothetical protein C1645_879790 [Glomus cerebriforme]